MPSARLTGVLPVEKADCPSEDERDQSSRAGCARVLAVDDNAATSRVISLLLDKLGASETETATSGRMALERMQEFQPDIVLLDIGLPEMDGYAVARTIRSRREFDHVLLVALTGYGQEEDRRKSQEAGFDEHIVKPPALEALRQLFSHTKLLRTEKQGACYAE